MKQPNILLISMDDAFAYWRFKTAFGARLQTPNLDRICEHSTAFQSAYCQVPVCGPSRSSFMSGLAPHQTGILDNYSEISELLRPDQMWSSRLKEAGYYCGTSGKIHHGYKPRPPEVHDALYSHESRTCNFGPRRNAPAKPYGGAGNGIGTTDAEDDKYYYDHQSSDSAIDFLTGYSGDQPFYREVGFHNPHPPFPTPDRFKAIYEEDEFTIPPEWADGNDINPFAASSFPPNMSLKNQKFWRQTVRNYFSGYSHADWHIGRVWDALKASGHADNTIVMIVADHGYHMGDKGRFRKYTMWEEAAGVPLIIHDPRQNKGRVVNDPVALIDVGQTVMDYAGLPPIYASPGHSLRSQVEGADIQGRAVPTFWFGSASIRKGGYRYISYQDGTEQLFDLDQDPWQLRNIAENHPQLSTLRRALAKVSGEYGLTYGDTQGPASYVSVPEGAAQPATPPTLGQFSFEAPMADTPDMPGWRRYFLRPRQDMETALPNAWRELFYAGDIGDQAERLTVTCNDLGCHLDFMGGHQRLNLTVHGGRGDDRIETAHDPLTVYLNAGNNVVEAGFVDSLVHGGSGHDRIECQRANNRIYGGIGSSEIICGIGHDIIHTGDGANLIEGSTGSAEVTIDGGTNVIRLGRGKMALKFLRTGLPQTVTGYDGGPLDLSAWPFDDKPRLTESGDDIVLTWGTERVVFIGADLAKLRSALADAV